MAQYKVPQDVEADDKLIGPFSFRQFVYLLIAGGLIAMGVGLFQLFPLLAIVPIIPAFLFLVLALPLKKDQPMETYLAAIVSFYLKPRKRVWTPGQRESTILITAPKIVEDVRTRDLSQEEATHRLSFLADIVDTEGFAIKNGANPMRDDLMEEAKTATDMFDSYHSQAIDQAINKDKTERHTEVINEMKQAIVEAEEAMRLPEEPVKPAKPEDGLKDMASDAIVKTTESVVVEPEAIKLPEKPVITAKPDIIELANNPDYSVATIAKEANRIKRKDQDEVFISLH